jgi:glucosamine-6-phosphate deaminase
MTGVIALTYGKMPVEIYKTNEALGQAAADDFARIVGHAVDRRGEAAVILATGNSQLSFMRALRSTTSLAWDRITIFHMDEYLGMSDQHPASFRRYIREKLTDVVKARRFVGMKGDAADVEAEMVRYTTLLAKHEPVVCVLGIGENGHLAFNDPPADFDTDKTVHVVTLAETARRQQVGEGHFSSLAEVPRQALSLTVPALLAPPHVLAVVPEARKAAAVKAALEGPVTPECPASILRTQEHTKLYLDRDSASMLELTGRG